ncbi:MAG: putative LPS assembly protein LptD, partial [Bacteroidia bacterium]|nr:putative LPS assembly protein LptD [Bacteroidia bacterium]
MQIYRLAAILTIISGGYTQLVKGPRQDSIPPSLWDSLTRQSPAVDTVFYQAADSISLDLIRGEGRFYREVQIKEGKVFLQTGYASVLWGKGWVYGKGRPQGDSLVELPVLYYNQERYEMDSLRYDLNHKRGQIFGMRQRLPDETFAGRTLQINPDGTFYAAGAYYTTCTAMPPHFYFSSTRIKLYPEERIVSGPLYMVVGDVPMPLFSPFGYFPLLDRRSSGIILPLVGQAADRGFFVRGLGYYWAINRYMDARIEADIFTRGGFRTELLWTYRKKYWHEGNFSIQYAYQAFNEPGDPDYQALRMIFVRWIHQQTLSPTATFSANVQGGSSAFLSRQSYQAADFLSTNLQSSIALQKTFPASPWQLVLSTNHTQNLIQKVWSIQAPVLALYQNRIFPFQRKKVATPSRWYEKIGYTYRLDAQGLIQIPESLLFQPLMRDTFNWGLRHNIQIAGGYTIFRYFQFAPSFTYNEYLYGEQRTYSVDTLGNIQERRLRQPRAARDFGAGFNLTTRLYGIRIFPGRRAFALRHTIIPSAGIQWRPDFSLPRWKLYQTFVIRNTERRLNPLSHGFYGSPPSGRQMALVFSINNLLEARYKDLGDTTGRRFKYLSLLDNFGLSSSYNFAADSFHLSPIILTARTNLLSTFLNLNYTATLDAYRYDSGGVRRPFYRWDIDRKVGTITQMNWALVLSLAPFASQTPPGEKEEGLVFFSLPWRADLSYNLVGVRQFFPDSAKYRWIQTLGLSAEVNITRTWRIQV